MKGMSMQMTFNFNVDPVLLFNFWHPKSASALAASCVFIFCLAAAFEALKTYREKLYVEASLASSAPLSAELPSRLRSMFSADHLKQTVLYSVQLTLGYLLMLLFMTFNGFVAITVVAGAAFGFLVTGWKKFAMLEMVGDHCG